MDAREKEILEDVLAMATAGRDVSINLVVEAISEDNHATESLVAFMDGITTGDNPTLLQIQYNQQLTNALFKHVADYIVRD